jgi:two-component system sensor histidine kinase VanS
MSDVRERGGLIGWRPRLTVRARLTLVFTALVAIAGVAMVVVVSIFMRTVPTYVDATAAYRPASIEVTSDNVISSESEGFDGAEWGEAAPTIALSTPSEILTTTLVVAVIALVLVVVAGAVSAWIMAGRLLRPLRAINDAAQLAGTGSFDHRVGLAGPRDELHDLSDTFDDMLERLDRSFAASQRFAANASHELQTPLAATQTMLEVALADPTADATELRAVAQRVLETNRRNIETVESLLELSGVEGRSASVVEVPLASVVRAEFGLVQDEVREREVRVTMVLDDTATTLGTTVLVRHAVGNLVRNAVRHNIRGGTIEARLESVGDVIEFRLTNTGTVIPEASLGSLTEPFTRTAGRTAGGGHGLGLAIVASAARALGGNIHLEANPGGGMASTLTLPRGSEARRGT